MKKVLSIIVAIAIILSLFVGCNANDVPLVTDTLQPSETSDAPQQSEKKILVAYFSKTGTTESVALEISEAFGADTFEISRKEPYPSGYSETTAVARQEKADGARPELKEYLPKETIENFDVIFIGFPIWYGTTPMPVLTFLENYDLSGKTIYTFCTSGGSGIAGSTADITSSAKNAKVIEGKRFSSNGSGVSEWINSLGLSK